MNSTGIKKELSAIAAIVISILFLILPALRIGYPLLHGDSGVPIISGFEQFAPVERPITYGLFVWITSLGISLWFVIIAQAAITAFVIYIFMSRCLDSKYLDAIYLAAIIILSLTTSIGYFVCQIKPDFLLPVAFLAFYSLLTSNGNNKWQDAALGIILLVSLLAHLSHLPIITGLFLATVALIFIFKKLRFNIYLKKSLVLLILILSAWLIAPAINHYFTGYFKLSRVSNVFSVSRLIQAGVFQKYVHEKCAEDPGFIYCKYNDDLDRYVSYIDFLWDSKSFLYDYEYPEGNLQYCWVDRNKEFGMVVKDIYAHPKFLKLFIQDALKTSLIQLVSVNIPEYDSYVVHSYPAEMVQKFLPADSRFLEKSKQSKQKLTFPVQNVVQTIFILLTLGFILFMIFRKKGLYFDHKLILPGWLILVFLTGNAFFIGIFAGQFDRFQSRIIWLIPLYAIILLLHTPRLQRLFKK